MTRSFSIYLDMLRFFAAFLVLLFHSKAIYNPGLTIFGFGHEAVVIFFVLSGFVIAFVADTKEHTLKDYTISRMARIYSVAIPAILLTGLIDFAGFSIKEAAYPEGYQAWDYFPIRMLSSLFFMNEPWIVSIQLFSNVPYWSLNYEVWYYIGFALLTYIGGKKGWFLFIGAGLLIGPKILMLLPLWWCGVFIYRSEMLKRLPQLLNWFLLLLSIFGTFAYIEYGIGQWGWNYFESLVGSELHREFAFSRQFMSDYYLALVIAIHFVGVRGLCSRYVNVFNPVEWPVRKIAASTFSLYLLHQPLLIFYHAVLYEEEIQAATFVIILVLTLITALIVSYFTEQKKHVWKRWIVAAFNAVEYFINGRFGTHRGLIRTILADLLFRLGFYRKYGRIDFSKVKRLVFVCQGNICRSPFAHYVAADMISYVPVVSMGLATSTGANAFETAQDVAQDFSVDLSSHRTTNIGDFKILDGDLFLVMEDRHIRQLKPHIEGRDVQIGLLGLWCRPRFALLYDPHRLSRPYFSSCFKRIKQAVSHLGEDVKSAQRSA